MTDIGKRKDICTQITSIKLEPGKEEEALKLMLERAHFMATQPGFISVNLHRSKDGRHLVNYIQWASPEKLKAAHRSSEFREKWPRFGEIATEIDPGLYDVVYSQAA